MATKLALAATTTSMDMDTEEFDRIKARLIFKWPKTLIDKLGFNHIDAPPLKAKMLANAPPCHTSAARRIPHNYLEQAGEMIATLLKEGVIERSPEATSWTSPAFFIPKNDRTKLRFIVDLSYLNGFLIRSIHEFPTPYAIVTAIASTAAVFCCMDLKDGYLQVLLSPELSALTSFILPAELKKYSGKFKFLRAPHGLSVSRDAFVRLTDEALFNDGCPGTPFNSQVFKCVDDMLVASPNKKALLETCDEILKRLEARNIKVSKSKVVMGTSVDYCGYVVSDKGISPNEDRITALKHMTPPTTVREVRSLLGALQQLKHYLPDLSNVMQPINDLLKKGREFIWGEEQQLAWTRIHEILAVNLQTCHFDRQKKSIVITDAASKVGLGGILAQINADGTRSLIACCSRSLTD